MSEVKDPKIKLFGKTIEIPDKFAAAERGGTFCEAAAATTGEDSSNQDPACTSDSMLEDSNFNRDSEEQESRESTAELDHRFRESVRIIVPSQSDTKQDRAKEAEQAKPMTSEEINDSNMPCVDSEDGSAKTSKTEQEQSETSNSQDKTLKKPDKILPCPRCNSMDTKFCYFNNYNVNQPRHFCKNCQRYWTAGGTMRNVPVGAGRRKNKNSVPQFRHLTVPEPLPNGAHHPALNPTGTVLTFGSDTPLSGSMASALNIIDKNRFHKPEEINGDHRGNDEAGRTRLPEMTTNCHPFPPQMPCYPGAPWPYPWNPVQWGPPQFYPTPPPYWGCAVPGSWNIPWVIPPNGSSQGPNSPTLGKHSRDDSNNLKSDNKKDEKALKESGSEKCLWFPKTLRIDDPGEAAKSSIWATLGIKNDSVVGGGLFEPFQGQTKGDEKIHVLETSTVLQANPAAFSRSLSFHERS